MSSKCHCVYLLSGKTASGADVEYYGTVQVFDWQTCEQAAQSRRSRHLAPSSKVHCLAQLQRRTAKITPITHRLDLDEALAHEAVRTIVAFHTSDQNTLARGGPYCRINLPAADRAELSNLQEICNAPSWAEKVILLRELALRFPRTSSMRIHLEDRCFK